jgi:hypothetical protein
MADKKISALTASTTPLAGSEVLPIVQSGTTVKVSVANLTAGRAVSASSLTASTENVIIGTTAKGITTGSAIPLGLGVNNTVTAMTIDTNSNVGVGTTAPDIFGRFYTRSVGINSSGTTALQINGTTYGAVDLGFNGVRTANLLAETGGFYIQTVNASNMYLLTNGLERLRVGSTGDVTIATGNFIVGTAGKGIDFSANGGDILSQYDEGTWTVVWTNLTGTPSNTTGYFTRIGRMVFFTYAAGANSISGTGDVVKFTLPFTPGGYAAGSMISQTNTNSGSVLIDTSAVAYPNTFSASFMVFSGVFYI